MTTKYYIEEEIAEIRESEAAKFTPGYTFFMDNNCPRVVAGPFDTLDEAKAALHDHDPYAWPFRSAGRLYWQVTEYAIKKVYEEDGEEYVEMNEDLYWGFSENPFIGKGVLKDDVSEE